jgi:hypothetical protein
MSFCKDFAKVGAGEPAGLEALKAECFHNPASIQSGIEGFSSLKEELLYSVSGI